MTKIVKLEHNMNRSLEEQNEKQNNVITDLRNTIKNNKDEIITNVNDDGN